MDSRADTQPGVELTIDELVLEGFPRSSRVLVGDAIERELTRLIAEQGSQHLSELTDMPLIDAGAIQLHATTSPETLGRAIALALYEGMQQCARG